jgi:hypothetical protein
MSCINPKTGISAENCGTLGPKIQNARKCNLKVVGGALKEAVHSYAMFSPNTQVQSVETPKIERVVPFSGNPRRVVRFCRRERTTCLKLVQWLLQDLCSETMLDFHYARLKHEVYFILAFT